MAVLTHVPSVAAFPSTAVIFRDPRDVVVSEFHMRRDFYHQARVKGVVLDDFVRERFEVRLRVVVVGR